MEVTSQCRLCLKYDSAALCVFDDVDSTLTDKIYECFGIQIKQDDPLTQKLCRCCYFFTNSVYKYRVASQENNLKLKKEYEEKLELETKLENDNSQLTQNDFLNNLKLTNNVTITLHKSIVNLKRKFPNINIPESCNNIDMEPFVDVLNSPKRKSNDLHDSDNHEKIMILRSRKKKKSYSLDKKHRCSKCHKYFSKSKLRLHKCLHKSYTCSICCKIFVSSFHYQKHLLTHSENEPDIKIIDTKITETKIIDDTNIKETTINDIKTPEKTPTKETPSEILNESPANLPETKIETEINELKTPEKIPTKVIPSQTLNESPGNLLVEGEQVNAFVCLTCNKIFDTQGSLANHKLVHKLSLRCNKCPKKFPLVEALIKHQETHKVVRKRGRPFKHNYKASSNDKKSSVKNTDESSSEGALVIDVKNKKNTTTLTPVKENKSPLKLPQLNVTLKPLTSLESSPIKVNPIDSSSTKSSPTKSSPIKTTPTKSSPTKSPPTKSSPTKSSPERGRIIARKHTDGALFNKNNSTSTDTSSSLSSSSSSDEDDCEITDVSEISKEQNEDVLNTALEPQTIHPIEFISTTDIKPIIPPIKQDADLTAILIIDSDSEGEIKKSKTIETTEIISSGDESTSKKNTPPPTATTSDTPIIISASPEENTSTSITTKVKNELNYINYLFGKCSSDENNLTNGTQHWNLQKIKQLARHKIIPIEINRVRDPNVTVKYIPTARKKYPPVPLIPWSHAKAIDLNGGKSTITSKSKQLNSNLPRSQKAAIKFPIPATVKPKIVNGPKTGQFVTKYVPSGDVVERKLIFDRKIIFAPNKSQSQENIPNKTNTSTSTNYRSVLKNVQTSIPQLTTAATTAPQATTPPVGQQPIVYTYVATPQMLSNQNFLTLPTTSNPPTEQYVLPIQQSINKNTIVFQQQPNFINITQPTFFATTDNTGQIYLKQPTNLDANSSPILPAEVPLQPPILQPEKITPDQEQMNEVTSSSVNQNNQNDSGGHRPMIRIKKLSELTASSTTEQPKDELNSYLNAYTNYVSTRT